MNSETIISDSDAFEASFRKWFWSDDKKDGDADVIEDALAKDLDANEKVGDEAPVVDVALPSDVIANGEQNEVGAENPGFLFAETIIIDGEVVDSAEEEEEEHAQTASDHEEEVPVPVKAHAQSQIQDSESDDDEGKTALSITEIIEASLNSGRELRRSNVRYNYSSDEDDFLKTSSSSPSDDSDSDQVGRRRRGRGRPPKGPPRTPPSIRGPNSRRSPKAKQTEEELVQQIAQETKKGFVCRSCFKSFAYVKCLRNHYEAQHPDWLNGPDEEHLLSKVSTSKPRKHRCSDDDIQKIEEQTEKLVYETQPMKSSGHDYQSPLRRATPAKETESTSGKVASVPTKEPNLPEPNAATYSIVVTVKGPPSFIKTYSRPKVLTDSIERILQSPASSPKNIMIVPSSISSQVLGDCPTARVAVLNKSEQMKQKIECNGNDIGDDENSQEYHLENHDNVEIIYPTEEVTSHPEELVFRPDEGTLPSEEVIYSSEEVLVEDMSDLMVDSIIEDIPYVCNEIVVETEDDLIGGNRLALEDTDEAESPEQTTEVESRDPEDNVPKRQPVVCLERLDSEVVEQFATRLRPRPGRQVNNRVAGKEKAGSNCDSQRKQLRCNVCGWRFRHHYHLQVHILNHAKSSTFECLACHNKFSTKRAYDGHLLSCPANVTTTEMSVSNIGDLPKAKAECNTKMSLEAEPLLTMKGVKAEASESPIVDGDASDSEVPEERVTRRRVTSSQKNNKVENKRKLVVPEKQIIYVRRKKQKVEEELVNKTENDSELPVQNGNAEEAGANLTSEDSMPVSGEVLEETETSSSVRKSKRRGASSGAGYYFWMHHGQFQRNVCFHHPHTEVSKKRKMNGMHLTTNKQKGNQPPVSETDSAAAKEVEPVPHDDSFKQNETATRNIPAAESRVIIAESDPKDAFIADGGDVDSEITLHLEDLDDVDTEVEKLAENPCDVEMIDHLSPEEKEDLQLKAERSVDGIMVDIMHSDHVPIETVKESLVPSRKVVEETGSVVVTDVPSHVIPEDTGQHNVSEVSEPDIATGVEEDEKSRPSSAVTVSTEVSLKLSESTEMSAPNSNLPSPFYKSDPDKSDELSEVDRHTLDLDVMGLKAVKSDLNFEKHDRVDVKLEVQLTGCEEVVKPNEFESSDELTDGAAPNISSVTEVESSPTTGARRKAETPGYYSWLNGAQFRRRKSLSSSEASDGQAKPIKTKKLQVKPVQTKVESTKTKQAKSEGKVKKEHICKVCNVDFKFYSNLQRHLQRRYSNCSPSGKKSKDQSPVQSSPRKVQLSRNNLVDSSKRKANLEAKLKAKLKDPQISSVDKKRYLKLLSRTESLSTVSFGTTAAKRDAKPVRPSGLRKSSPKKKLTLDALLCSEVKSKETPTNRDKMMPENKLSSIRKKSELAASNAKKTPSSTARSSQKLALPQKVDQDLKSKDKNVLVSRSPKNKTINGSKPMSKKQDIGIPKHTNVRDVKLNKEIKHSTQKLTKHGLKTPTSSGDKRKSSADSTTHLKRDGAKGKELSSVRSKVQNEHVRPRKMSDINKSNSRTSKSCDRVKPLAKVHSVDDDLKTERKQGYQCKFCDHEFKHYFSWRYHIAMDHGTQTVCCPLCQKWQHLQNDTLEQHLQTHFRREQFDNKAIVQRLVLLLIEHKPLPNLEHLGIHYCEWCNSAFGSRYSLEKHQRHEAVNKPHQCPLCGRRFADILQLEPHIISHAQTDSLRCKWCDKLFSDVASLEFHEEHHSKYFKCDLCQKNFKSQVFLRRHQEKGCGVQNPPSRVSATQNSNATPRPRCSASTSVSDSASVSRTSNLFDVFGEALSALRSQSQTQNELAQSKKNLVATKRASKDSSVVKNKLSPSVTKKQSVNQLAAVSSKKSALT